MEQARSYELIQGLPVIEYFAKLLKIIQGHCKWRYSIDHIWLTGSPLL